MSLKNPGGRGSLSQTQTQRRIRHLSSREHPGKRDAAAAPATSVTERASVSASPVSRPCLPVSSRRSAGDLGKNKKKEKKKKGKESKWAQGWRRKVKKQFCCVAPGAFREKGRGLLRYIGFHFK